MADIIAPDRPRAKMGLVERLPLRVKTVVREALESLPGEREQCEHYARHNGFENLDFLLELEMMLPMS